MKCSLANNRELVSTCLTEDCESTLAQSVWDAVPLVVLDFSSQNRSRTRFYLGYVFNLDSLASNQLALQQQVAWICWG